MSANERPIIVFGFPAVGDFVRCHSLIRMISSSFPDRPIDVVGRAPAIEIAQFMPEVRNTIAESWRHRRLDLNARLALAQSLRRRNYETAYIIPSSFKAALVPFLARIPERIGWAAEFRRPLLNRPRFGMQQVPRMVDRICVLGLAHGDHSVATWPEPRLRVPGSLQNRYQMLLQEARSQAPVVTLAPGSSGPEKNWPIAHFVTLARHCIKRGCSVWIVGSSAEGQLAAAIGQHVPVQDRTMDSIENLALTIAAADVFVGNDSGPLHIAAGLDKPSVGIFGMTDPWDCAPINSVADIPIPDRVVAWRSRTEFHWPTPEQVIRSVDNALDAAQQSGRTVDGDASAGRSTTASPSQA
jgi:heptosyltransferase-2